MENTNSNHFEFSDKLKKTTIALMVVGIISTVVAYFVYQPQGHGHDGPHNNQMWSNLLINAFYFTGIALAALFFMVLQYIASAGWSAGVKRIFEAISSFLPVGGSILILILILGAAHQHHLYHWMDGDLYDKNSPEYDSILDGKQAWLNTPFFLFRAVVYVGVWTAFQRYFRNNSLLEDQNASRQMEIHSSNVKWGAAFIVFFAGTSSSSAWDWLMSLDPHWFSTMFGWYTFAGTLVSTIITTVLIVTLLHSQDKAKHLNENHLHDLGKFMFGFSVFWTYLWFSQFMLIWYANISEEVAYFQDRYENYKGLFILNLLINFVLPFLSLVMRPAKRNGLVMGLIGIIIFIGHWLDVFLIVTPAAMQEYWSFGILEVGMFLGFLGLFAYVVLNTLSKAALYPKNHPFMQESLHHQI